MSIRSRWSYMLFSLCSVPLACIAICCTGGGHTSWGSHIPWLVLFPYSRVASEVLTYGSSVAPTTGAALFIFGLMLIQMPVYGLILTIAAWRDKRRPLIATTAALLVLHLAGSVMAVIVHESPRWHGVFRAGMEPLKYEIPEQKFFAIDQDELLRKHPGLEDPWETAPFRPLMVPSGTTNIALNKPVASSHSGRPVSGELQQITDGKKMADTQSLVELPPGLHWVQIDLGQSYAIYAILLWHRFDRPQAFHDIIVQAADDSAFQSDVRILYSNDRDNSAQLGRGNDPEYIESHLPKRIIVNGARARFIRLYSRGSTAGGANVYTEVEIYGKLE